MTADVAIATAIYDAYDSLKPPCPQDGLDVDWVLVTDVEPLDSLGWRVKVLPRPGLHPCRASKLPKFRPWEFTNAPASIWIDASFRVTSPRFAADLLAAANPIAQFPHPWNTCIFKEAEDSAGFPEQYGGEPVAGQAAHYRTEGHPESWGLWAGGVIARRHTPEVLRFGAAWAAEVNHWSFQDQVSEPFVLRNHGLRPHSLPGTPTANRWLSYEPSARHR